LSRSPQPPAESKIRAVLFDLGNTLIYLDVTVDRLNELRVRHLHSVLPAMGISIQFEEFQEKLAQLWETSFFEAERTEKEYPATRVFAEIARNLGVTEEALTPSFSATGRGSTSARACRIGSRFQRRGQHSAS